MAPLSLAWESEPGKVAPEAAICATLKRMDNDDGPDYERLIEYAQFASSVLWAWEPGKRSDGRERSTPLLTHEEFVAALKRWISAGALCPGEVAPTAASPEPEDNAPAEPVPAEPLPAEPSLPEAAPSDAAPAERPAGSNPSP